MRVEIVEDDVKLAIREGSNEAVHEAEEFDTATPLGMLRDDPPGGNLKRCEQGRGAVPPVVVALPGQSAAVRQLQVALRPLQSLDRRLLVDTEDDRLGGRMDVKANDVGGFRHEVGVVALAPGFADGKINIVLTQEAPHVLNINVAHRRCQQRPRPPGKPLRWRLIQKCQNALVRRLAVDRLLACPRTLLQTAKALLGKAPPPATLCAPASRRAALYSVPGRAPQAPCVPSA